MAELPADALLYFILTEYHTNFHLTHIEGPSGGKGDKKQTVDSSLLIAGSLLLAVGSLLLAVGSSSLAVGSSLLARVGFSSMSFVQSLREDMILVIL